MANKFKAGQKVRQMNLGSKYDMEVVNGPVRRGSVNFYYIGYPGYKPGDYSWEWAESLLEAIPVFHPGDTVRLAMNARDTGSIVRPVGSGYEVDWGWARLKYAPECLVLIEKAPEVPKEPESVVGFRVGDTVGIRPKDRNPGKVVGFDGGDIQVKWPNWSCVATYSPNALHPMNKTFSPGDRITHPDLGGGVFNRYGKLPDEAYCEFDNNGVIVGAVKASSLSPGIPVAAPETEAKSRDEYIPPESRREAVRLCNDLLTACYKLKADTGDIIAGVRGFRQKVATL